MMGRITCILCDFEDTSGSVVWKGVGRWCPRFELSRVESRRVVDGLDLGKREINMPQTYHGFALISKESAMQMEVGVSPIKRFAVVLQQVGSLVTASWVNDSLACHFVLLTQDLPFGTLVMTMFTQNILGGWGWRLWRV